MQRQTMSELGKINCIGFKIQEPENIFSMEVKLSEDFEVQFWESENTGAMQELRIPITELSDSSLKLLLERINVAIDLAEVKLYDYIIIWN